MQEKGGEWVVTFATDKSGGAFNNPIIALSDTPVTADPDTQVTLYGTMNGTYTFLSDQGQELTYPRVNLAFID